MELKHKRIFIVFAFVCLVGGIVGGWDLFSGIMVDDCERIKNGIYNTLELQNYCDTDSDCAVVRVLNCPFGCTNYVNKKYDISILEREYEKFYSCTEPEKRCQYECVPPRPAVCVFNKCVESL